MSEPYGDRPKIHGVTEPDMRADGSRDQGRCGYCLRAWSPQHECIEELRALRPKVARLRELAAGWRAGICDENGPGENNALGACASDVEEALRR